MHRHDWDTADCVCLDKAEQFPALGKGVVMGILLRWQWEYNIYLRRAMIWAVLLEAEVI